MLFTAATKFAPIQVTLDDVDDYDSPVISTPCDETLPEYLVVGGAIAFLFLAAMLVGRACFGAL